MLLDLNKKFIGLNGQESEMDETLGRILAAALSSKKGKLSPLKVMPWAFKLFENQPIEIDHADLKSLYEFVETLDTLTPLAVYQLMEEINKLLRT